MTDSSDWLTVQRASGTPEFALWGKDRVDITFALDGAIDDYWWQSMNLSTTAPAGHGDEAIMIQTGYRQLTVRLPEAFVGQAPEIADRRIAEANAAYIEHVLPRIERLHRAVRAMG